MTEHNHKLLHRRIACAVVYAIGSAALYWVANRFPIQKNISAGDWLFTIALFMFVHFYLIARTGEPRTEAGHR